MTKVNYMRIDLLLFPYNAFHLFTGLGLFSQEKIVMCEKEQNISFRQGHDNILGPRTCLFIISKCICFMVLR